MTAIPADREARVRWLTAEEIRAEFLMPGDVLCHMIHKPGEPDGKGGWKRGASRPAAWRVRERPRRVRAGARERVFVRVEDTERGGVFTVDFSPEFRIPANLVKVPGRRGRRIE